MSCNWQQADWPEFRFGLDSVAGLLGSFTDHAGRVGGLLEGLPGDLETEAVLDLMIAEAVRSSAIEGEVLSLDEVRSSIRNRLHLVNCLHLPEKRSLRALNPYGLSPLRWRAL